MHLIWSLQGRRERRGEIVKCFLEKSNKNCINEGAKRILWREKSEVFFLKEKKKQKINNENVSNKITHRISMEDVETSFVQFE